MSAELVSHVDFIRSEYLGKGGEGGKSVEQVLERIKVEFGINIRYVQKNRTVRSVCAGIRRR